MNTSMNTSITASTAKSNNTKKTPYEYKADSYWSNIKYMLAMLAVIIIPPLIPGVTTEGLVMSYVGIVLGIYILAFIFKLVLVVRLKNHPQIKRR